MKVICDATKDAINKEKHGVSLHDAMHIDWDAALIWQDTRHDYGEVRMIALAPIDERLYCVVYVDREDHRRIISLRKANYREVIHYANQD
ncbi:MAG TPA: BrnT family toxin [Nitrosomonas sp.]|nr:BrnT family toxin [Nitrosomonas sp.]HMW70121.1 BrnT family toxin [Nitrosomonas sp.]HMY62163.1 BrnT family toxin [Nitrosomonas sp.]HMY91195.1 BrnT family toxin [Nitrosomonas sp.]HNA71499.1 BrnT family toxin [Nitrosomonas sp.]